MTKLEYVQTTRIRLDQVILQEEIAEDELRAACLEAAEVSSLEEVAAAARLTRARIRQWVARAKREATRS